MLYPEILSLIGTPPLGFEPLAYLFSILVLFFLLSQVFGILWNIINWIGGR